MKFPTKVNGAERIIWYNNTYGSDIMLIGENHENTGDGTDLMRYLQSFDSTKCFDVYLESSFAWKIPSNEWMKSRLYYCTHKGNTCPNSDRLYLKIFACNS